MSTKPLPHIPPQTAWHAVLQRDRDFDGQFVFAVSTTGIYCRPSCPARRPSRKNITFFNSHQQAQDAGYRPCRRCHPNASTPDRVDRAVNAALRYLHAHAAETVTLDALASHVGFSKFHLQRLFQRIVGLSPRQFQAARKIASLKAAMQAGGGVALASYQSGFGSSRALYEHAHKHLGMTPGQYRRGASNMPIAYATAASHLGRILIAATPRGVCSVILGRSNRDLNAQLAREFPHAQLLPSRDPRLSPWLTQVLASLSRPRNLRAIPLDLQGTVFQIRVWKALQSIPRGATRTYSQLACDIHAPSAARAVAHACARNRIAILVPCHRVIRRDGRLGGYRWGIRRKQALLDQERTAS